MSYGLFEWVFWVLAFCMAFLALARIEVFSTHSSQRAHRHSGQQVFLWIMAVIFALSGFLTAVLSMRAGH
ncbi:hypothetical protein AAGW05_06710 [Arthrobacter sp. LAPM80]|uniref:hypothetical protein n=1 Tax=Arthrobacter sp. LAPM80 TaxID=3141788 RepID=UPI00398AEB59